LLAAQLFASWLSISNYSRFYAGLTSIMSALVFFQVSAIIVILGAELNRGLVEMKRRFAMEPAPADPGAFGHTTERRTVHSK
jgi:membrane protein